MKRDPAIELFRVLLIFGVCLLHVAPSTRISQLLVSCVPGFVLISGYFGIRFKWSKILKLYLVAVYASLIVPLVGGAWEFSAYVAEVLCVWNIRLDAVQPSGFWFLHAYAVMSVLAMPIEMILEGELTHEKMHRLWRISGPLLIVVFGWGFLTKFAALAPLVPTVNGLQSFSPITLFASYLVGKNLIVWEKCNGKISLRISLFCFVISSGVLFFSRTYLCAYNSIVSVLFAASAFCLFREIRLPVWFAKIVLAISPSMFAVYLIHVHMHWVGVEHSYMIFGRQVRQFLLPSLGMFGSIFMAALTVFVVACVLDLPRRLGGWVLRRWFYKSPKRVLSIT